MEVLNRTATIEGETVSIVEEIKANYTRDDLQSKVFNIQRRKARIVEENKTLIAEFNKLTEEEEEYNSFIAVLDNTKNETPAKIE